MELSHSLLLNEEALSQTPEAKRPVFVFEWLRFLDRVMVAAQKSDIKGHQKKLVEQLTQQIHESPGPPTRKLIARCLATLFSVGDTFLLFDTVNKCNDILKNKDDSPSFLSTKLAAISCIGAMYEKLGRMMGRSYEETVQILLKTVRNIESQARVEIMISLEKVCAGMGSAASNVHKDIYKACRNGMTDRALPVRCAAATCLMEMLNHAPFLYTSELENVASLCFRAFDGSNYEVRCAVSRLLGTLLAMTQQPPSQSKPGHMSHGHTKPSKTMNIDECLSILNTGFLKGGTGFLKGTGEMIKGSTVSREVRVGVTHSYVILAQVMGGLWLERNLSVFMCNVLELVSNPRATSSHVDAVYSRKCVMFILEATVGRMLGESTQMNACKDLSVFILKQMNSLDVNTDGGRDISSETQLNQHALVCALHQLGSLLQGLGTMAATLVADLSVNLVDAVFAVLLHPMQAARFAAAWCLRCLSVAVPSQLAPFIDRCNGGLENLRSSPEAISGYSASLAALLGCVQFTPLGVPHTRGKIIFNTAEELLRTAHQNSRLSLQRTQAGWLLIGAVMSLGVPVVRTLLPRLLLLWRNSFPRSTKEFESEKARGDAFTWQITLEGRAGALSTMHSFILNCNELVTDDVVRRLLTPIESALAMLTNISGIVKTYGQHLKASAAMVRLRLYETLSLLPPQSFDSSYTHLLRLLVAEFTLAENPANTTTSLLRVVCHTNDATILGSWLQATDHRPIEDQLLPSSAAGSGAVEHDPCSLFRPLPEDESIPGPLPLGVAVIDMSVTLFGLIFPRVANKHRLQMLHHFTECIKQAKSTRQEAIMLNVFTAVLSGLKGVADAKGSFQQDDVIKATTDLILGSLNHSNALLRCAAGEALGRTTQVMADARFTAELAQYCFDKLKSARDVVSRTGHSLALGCIHRYVGSMGSGQHHNTSVGVLLALAQDNASPVVQVWALHALALIADSGGPMFRGYVEPTLSLALKLLLVVSPTNVDVHQCIGKLLAALITTVGPELQGNINSICTARLSFQCACAIMQDHCDALVQAEAVSCLQQLHMFAPRHVNLSSLVPMLCKTLPSSNLLLRRASVACLRQLTQREAKEVCEHALTLSTETKERDAVAPEGVVITETGLPGVLFGILDRETDQELLQNTRNTLTGMLTSLVQDNLSEWLVQCRNILTVAMDSGEEAFGEEGEGEEDDEEQFQTGVEPDTHPSVQPRWRTRVFAAECVQKILTVCEGRREHFDLALAKEMQFTRNKGDYLILHLSELIRLAFMAATSDSDSLRLEGLKTMDMIISKFAHVPEPEFPGHLLLEQYQAQVGAALRPAFTAETPPHVTAAACDVCSAWIGSGVARDLSDLRRVHHLLVTSLTKLKKGSNTQLYNESASTLEKLAILKAWAEVYIVAMKSSEIQNSFESAPMESSYASSGSADTDDVGFPDNNGDSLLNLVQPQLSSLSKHWLAALKDHALLTLPTEYSSQLPHEGGAFYTMDTIESARPYYRHAWASIMHAVTLWLSHGGFDNVTKERSEIDAPGSANLGLGPANAVASKSPDDINTGRFHLLFGTCMEALCNPRSKEPTQFVDVCLKALHTLLSTRWPRSKLGEDITLAIELCNVLHRVLLTHEGIDTQMLVLQVVELAILSAQEGFECSKKKKLRELMPANQEPSATSDLEALEELGEGGTGGDITPGKSLVFAVLEVCLCVLVRQMPALNPSLPSASALQMHSKLRGLSDESSQLIASAVKIMEHLPPLCSPLGAISVLPTILFLTTGIIKELATVPVNHPPTNSSPAAMPPVTASLMCIRTMCVSQHPKHPKSEQEWSKLLQSALANILDLAKTGVEESRLDDTTLIVALGVFILHATADVVKVPNLHYPCLNQLKHCLQNNQISVRIKCVQTLRSIFQHNDRTVSTPYIQSLAPRIIESLYHADPAKLHSDIELSLIVESIHTVEVLVGLCEPQHRVQMLALLVPVLVNFLLPESELPSCSKWAKQLHQHCLGKLMKVGPQFPQEFRTLMSQSPEMRLKLEAAVKGSQARTKEESDKSRNGSSIIENQVEEEHVPTIKLKTDFSNFLQ